MKKEIPFDKAKLETGTVLIEFYASWCPHCQRMMPVVENVRDLLGEQVPVYQYDIDKCQKAADQAGVETVPTFIIFRNGTEMWRRSGEMTAENLVKECDNVLEADV